MQGRQLLVEGEEHSQVLNMLGILKPLGSWSAC